jgi:hypothetical protein
MSLPTFFGAFLPELRKCPAGHDYWFPGERWQHKDCVVTPVVVTVPVVTLEENKEACRQVIWQRANRERYNAKMREYRRRARLPS